MLNAAAVPLSVVDAVREFRSHELHQLYVAAHGERSFDFFLAEKSWDYSALGELSESQIRHLVRLWVRTNAAKREVKGPYSVPATRTSDIVRRLALLQRSSNCLPLVDGLLTEAYWSPKVALFARIHGDRVEHVR